MDTVTIKYEKTISDCESCIFHDWKKGGYENSMIGTYYQSFCNRSQKYIKEHKVLYDYEEIELPIPESCPYKK